ncbi:MAG: SIR2 family protein [Deltaproteobacteria bacterium]|nr:SIR2 family protein [Deltaproteobacteria bacterium]
MTKYIEHFPKPLLDDLVRGRWLPVIGAGMSRNASVPTGRRMPLWNDLGEELAGELQDYPYLGAIDAVSAYEQEYGRPRMVERVAEALLVNEARPGAAHRAFCSIFFDIVCTTNVDFLLERQYENAPRYCRPIVDEDHLTINDQGKTIALLKLHGDVHHPTRLVLTEEDYDTFLSKYPLLATYLANLLITRTAVLIGYSLEDPDFRQVWQVIGERLGKARRLAYSLVVDAKATDVARFARRGVKVINLPGSKKHYSQILADTFNELREYMQTNILGASQVTTEEPLTELSLPQEAVTRLCFFAVPLDLQPQFRDQIFPLVKRAGLVPVTAADVISPGENYAAKIDAIMRRSVAAVVDLSTQNTILELSMLSGMSRPVQTFVIVEKGTAIPSAVADKLYVLREKTPIADQPELLQRIDVWLRRVAAEILPTRTDEPSRLFQAREYRAAVISAISNLESLLNSVLERECRLPDRFCGLQRLVDIVSVRHDLVVAKKQIDAWIRIRNMAVHSQKPVTRANAQEIVRGVQKLSESLRPLDYSGWLDSTLAVLRQKEQVYRRLVQSEGQSVADKSKPVLQVRDEQERAWAEKAIHARKLMWWDDVEGFYGIYKKSTSFG